MKVSHLPKSKTLLIAGGLLTLGILFGFLCCFGSPKQCVEMFTLSSIGILGLTLEANRVKQGVAINLTAGSARTGGEVAQLPDGRACVYPIDAASGALCAPEVEGVFEVTKPTAKVYLAGMKIYWDHSANATTEWPTSDKDFFLGTVLKDTASTDLSCYVALNVRPNCIFDSTRDPGRTTLVMTTAQGPAAGGVLWNRSGGAHIAKFGTAAEAQKADLLGARSVPTSSKWIWQGVVTVITTCDADVGDLNLGMADGTHASDADQIANSAFFHFDLGADLNIDVESDNVTAEVGATDSTIDFAEGTPVHLMIDGRSGDGSALKYYVNCVRVNSATALTLAGAAGPLKPLFIVEKSSNDSPGEVSLEEMNVWLSDDAAAVP